MEKKFFTIESSSTLLDAAQAIESNHNRCVIVVMKRKVIGVVSEGDLVRALLRGTDVHAPILPFIRHGICFLQRRNMAQALKLFRTYGFGLIPILNNQMVLKDIITLQELLLQVDLVPKKKIN